MSPLQPQATVAQIVIDGLHRARVLESFGIDYCCGGQRTLEEACQKDGQVLGDVLAALDQCDTGSPPPQVDLQSCSLADLVDHILEQHHAYLRRELPILAERMEKVRQAHGERHPELARVRATLNALMSELEPHMMKEEQILFPMVRQLETSTSLPSFHCGSVGNPMRVMEQEHDRAGELLRTLRELTNGYTPPADACTTWEALLHGLAALEHDLHLHVHKENNVLFPRTRKREAELAG